MPHSEGVKRGRARAKGRDFIERKSKSKRRKIDRARAKGRDFIERKSKSKTRKGMYNLGYLFFIF